jgi:hypothetical protein
LAEIVILPSWTEAEVPGRMPLVINSLELGRRSLGEVDFYQKAADAGAENASPALATH